MALLGSSGTATIAIGMAAFSCTYEYKVEQWAGPELKSGWARNSRVVWLYRHGYNYGMIQGGYYPVKMDKGWPKLRQRRPHFNRSHYARPLTYHKKGGGYRRPRRLGED